MNEYDGPEPDEEDYRVLTDLDMPAEWGIRFERGYVVLTSPALPVGASIGAIPIGHQIRFSATQLRRLAARVETEHKGT